ncbi:glycine dehydrogenase (decarboxylating) subunit 1 [subsurface metagenome]
MAELCYHKAHYAAEAISKLKRYSLTSDQPFFKEFVIRCPMSPEKINRALLKEQIIGGLDVSHLMANGMLLCVTEMNSRREIDHLVSVLEAL